MRLIRVGEPGRERPAVLTDDDRRVDVSTVVADLGGADFDETFFARDGLSALAAADLGSFPELAGDSRLGAPIARPSKIVCVGLNFRDHAAETGAPVPDEPILFYKATTAVVGPDDDLVLPRGSDATDWEVELAVVVGKTARYTPEAEALDHVAGYVLHNDVSERVHQKDRGGQWLKGKCHDTFAPMGPWMATREAIPDPGRLDMWLSVNGTQRQSSSTAEMIFGVAHLVAYISEFMTLLPGDVISTGTPAGVGLSHDPPTYLREGDVVELGIDGLGRARQSVVAAR